MPLIDEIKNDSRFYIDDFNLNRLFANREGGYEIAFVRVGSILRYWNGRIMSLSDTKVYPFLEGTEDGKQKYRQYCDFCNTSRRTAEIFTKLREDIESNDYDIQKGAIVIDEHNFILDGQHRSCILLYKYGPFHKIQVVQVDMSFKLSKRKRLKLFYTIQ